MDETIEILAEKAFKDDWFNKEYDLTITKTDLIELLEVATKNQLFQLEGNLYEQVDGVAMGSPLGPLMANTFMCNIEEQLINQNNMPVFYNRYVNGTLSNMPDVSSPSEFLSTLNEIHPSVNFTMECKYLRVFSQYLISHFTIVYKPMLILTSYLELENDRWTVETSFVFNVNFYYQNTFFY